MLTITKTAPNRVDIDLAGQLDSVAMEVGLAELIEVSKDVTNGRMLYKINEFALPTLGALGVEMAHLPALFGLLGKYDRCAVICDAAWIRTAAEVEGALFPGIDIKAFEPDQAEAAETWLEETSVATDFREGPV